MKNTVSSCLAQRDKNGLIAGALDGRPLAATPDFPPHFLPRPVNRRWAALLLTLAAHLLLALLYLAQRGAAPAAPSGPQRVFVALITRPAAHPAPPPRDAAPRRIRRPHRSSAPAARAQPEDASPRPAVEAAFPAPPPASADEILVRARRDLGRIDRQLRGAAPLPPLLRPDTPQARFEAALAGAWIDRSTSMTIDHYRSPDGVIIERINRGGGSACYMSGVVNFVPGILHDSSRPRAVSCPPPGSGWSRK